ncbi:MAG: M28 family peptidase [Deltaproteobacteria bacterium]|nr:M28 family peptidase [Deltaproteobacteria bacterium]
MPRLKVTFRGLVLALILAALPVMGPAAPVPEIAAIANQVQGANSTPAIDSFQDFLGSLPVNYGDQRGWSGTTPQPHLLAARTTIYNHLSALLTPYGGAVSYQNFTYYGYPGRNIVGVLPGRDPGNTQQYVLGAHYDAVNNPGVSDNASGVAGVLEAARVLSRYAFNATLVFIAFDLEEKGLWGSSVYASAAKSRGDNIQGMISLDMIVYNHVQNNRVEICRGYDANSTPLMNELALVYADYTPLTPNPRPNVWGSDHNSFADEGYPAVLVIEELTPSNTPRNPYYHQSTDFYLDSNGLPNLYGGLEYIDFDYAEEMTRGAVAWMAGEAGLVPVPAACLLFATGIAGLWGWRRLRGR